MNVFNTSIYGAARGGDGAAHMHQPVLNYSRLNLSNFLFDNRNLSIFGLNSLKVAEAAGHFTIGGGLQKDPTLDIPSLNKGPSLPFGGDPGALLSFKSGIMDMHNLFLQLDMAQPENQRADPTS
jgi:hypothetical protein